MLTGWWAVELGMGAGRTSRSVQLHYPLTAGYPVTAGYLLLSTVDTAHSHKLRTADLLATGIYLPPSRHQFCTVPVPSLPHLLVLAASTADPLATGCPLATAYLPLTALSLSLSRARDLPVPIKWCSLAGGRWCRP
jgi:hypothetical protein